MGAWEERRIGRVVSTEEGKREREMLEYCQIAQVPDLMRFKWAARWSFVLRLYVRACVCVCVRTPDNLFVSRRKWKEGRKEAAVGSNININTHTHTVICVQWTLTYRSSLRRYYDDGGSSDMDDANEKRPNHCAPLPNCDAAVCTMSSRDDTMTSLNGFSSPSSSLPPPPPPHRRTDARLKPSSSIQLSNCCVGMCIFMNASSS